MHRERIRKTVYFLLVNLFVLCLGIVGVLLNATPMADETYSPVEKSPLIFESKININTADFELLCLLPGIGEKRAEQIVTYREQFGYYSTLLDLYQAGIPYNVIDQLYEVACT